MAHFYRISSYLCNSIARPSRILPAAPQVAGDSNAHLGSFDFAPRPSRQPRLGLDLAPAAFRIGIATMTPIGHISVDITRNGEESFEIIVLKALPRACGTTSRQ